MSNPPTLGSRRAFLASAPGIAGYAGLLSLLESDGVIARAAQGGHAGPRTPHFAPRATNCIFIFLAGGTSQIELFDRKPLLTRMAGTCPPESLIGGLNPLLHDEYRKRHLMGSCYGFRRYGECGMEMSELLPHIGDCADDIALVRSMHHHSSDHSQSELLLSTGKDLVGRPSNGAWLSYGLGNMSRDLPAFVVLLNGRGPLARELCWGNGCLPSQHRGLLFRSRGEPILNLQNPAGLSRAVQRTRIDAISDLDRLRYAQVHDPEIKSRIASYELAFRLQKAAPDLIDLSRESASTHTAYGTQRSDEDGVFSRHCLLARRLVERGVRFVTLLQAKWDHHGEIRDGLRSQCRQVDQPVGALLKDLKSRGLLDTTLVVWATEFGRTPSVDPEKSAQKVGRDHHPFGFSMWMAGGGVRGGQVIGKTDEFSWHAVEDKVHVHDFNATMLHLFGLNHQELSFPSEGLQVRLTDLGHGEVVKQLIA